MFPNVEHGSGFYSIRSRITGFPTIPLYFFFE